MDRGINGEIVLSRAEQKLLYGWVVTEQGHVVQESQLYSCLTLAASLRTRQAAVVEPLLRTDQLADREEEVLSRRLETLRTVDSLFNELCQVLGESMIDGLTRKAVDPGA